MGIDQTRNVRKKPDYINITFRILELCVLLTIQLTFFADIMYNYILPVNYVLDFLYDILAPSRS